MSEINKVSQSLRDIGDGMKFCFNSKVRTGLTVAIVTPAAVAATVAFGAVAAPVAAATALTCLAASATRMEQFHNWRHNGMRVTTFDR